VTFEDGRIGYVDNIIEKGDCPDMPVKVYPPCGEPNYEYMTIECSSEEAIPGCDKVMKSLIIEDAEQ